MLAIRAKTVFPVIGSPYTDGTVLIGDDGKILTHGRDISVPCDAHVTECAAVTPGLIEAQSGIALSSAPRCIGNHGDSDECPEPMTPHVFAKDGFYPEDAELHLARLSGFTTVFTAPGHHNIIGGVGGAFKTKRGNDPYAMLIPGSEQMVMSVSEMPVRHWAGLNRAPATKAALWEMLVDLLSRAAEYAASADPVYDLRLNAMLPVMRGEMMLRVQVNRASDMREAMRLLSSYGIRFCFVNATESYLIADELASANVPVILGPLYDYPDRAEQMRARGDCAARLAEAGLNNLCFTGADMGEIESVRSHTGRLVAYGLPKERALEGLTLAAAKILGIDGRVGAIRAGLDADLALFNGEPLKNLTACIGTVIDGKLYDERRA